LRSRKAGGAMRDVSASIIVSNRPLNLAGGLIALVITGPLLLLIGAAILLESPGPVFDRRTSIDRHGRIFEELNFRTNAQGSWARNITQLGWFLRYTRMDALPRLINVVRGDITLIEIRDS
jgi:lipopolysaccharide/colanic/teichoic acid biosynthesis glycosyltransferase